MQRVLRLHLLSPTHRHDLLQPQHPLCRKALALYLCQMRSLPENALLVPPPRPPPCNTEVR